jgi:hypothetical protein
VTARLTVDLGLLPDAVTGVVFLGLGSDERQVLTVSDSEETSE